MSMGQHFWYFFFLGGGVLAVDKRRKEGLPTTSDVVFFLFHDRQAIKVIEKQ